MAKLFSHQLPAGTEAERSGVTPAQFLPSMMLSWRAPIMARPAMTARAAMPHEEAMRPCTSAPQQPAP